MCTVAKGKCGHAFHYHCITKWHKQGSQSCPIDSAPWNYVAENLDRQHQYSRLMKPASTGMSIGSSAATSAATALD
jgi:hypothetical protein